MTRRDIPNLISVGRLLLVPPVIWLILREQYSLALALVFIAGLSDALDGFLAKHYGWASELGGILDPLADKLLMLSAVLALWVNGLLPVWLAALIVLRDLIIVSGALSYLALIGRFQVAPSVISKFNTGVLILVLLAVMAAQAFRWDLELTPLFLLSGATTLASGIGYVVRWGRRARQEIAARGKP